VQVDLRVISFDRVAAQQASGQRLSGAKSFTIGRWVRVEMRLAFEAGNHRTSPVTPVEFHDALRRLRREALGVRVALANARRRAREYT
jgi:hypothetical protein